MKLQNRHLLEFMKFKENQKNLQGIPENSGKIQKHKGHERKHKHCQKIVKDSAKILKKSLKNVTQRRSNNIYEQATT